MPDLQALLAQIDHLDQEATPGPWEIVDEEYDDNTIAHVTRSARLETVERIVHADDATPADREFIALARTALPKLSEAVYHVLDLLDVVEKADKYAYGFGGSKSPSTVTTNEVRKAITDTLGDDDGN